MSLFLIIIILTFGISAYAGMKVRSNYERFSKVPAASGFTGAQAAEQIMRTAGIQDVQIVEGEGMLGDHYDPIHKRLVLSPANFRGDSVAALGIAAHEAGHALQHKEAYAPLTWRMAAVGVTQYANTAVMLLPVLGIFTGFIQPRLAIMLMCVAWGIIMLFNLVTLPVEFDASNRAKASLDRMGFIRDREEMRGVNKVLDAAALTYVAAFITSLAYLLYHLLPLLLGGRRSE